MTLTRTLQKHFSNGSFFVLRCLIVLDRFVLRRFVLRHLTFYVYLMQWPFVGIQSVKSPAGNSPTRYVSSPCLGLVDSDFMHP